ncbi:MAG: hypothetical protein LBF76_02310 [Holosporales bacterium]|jgi:hypothetical protein|nr:hypothetical protein [Holosporales bacterium]
MRLQRKIFSFVLFVSLLGGNFFAWSGEHWVIDRVFVESQGTNAVSAREKALIEGQRQAFLKLLTRLPISEDAKHSLMSTKDVEILPLIFDFSVQDEQLAPGTYRALLCYRFPKEGIAQWLEKKHISLQAQILSSKESPGSPLDQAFSEAFGTKETVLSTPSLSHKKSREVEKEIFVEVPIRHLSDWLEIRRRLVSLPSYQVYSFSQSWVVLLVSASFLEERAVLRAHRLLLKPVEGSWRLSPIEGI